MIGKIITVNPAGKTLEAHLQKHLRNTLERADAKSSTVLRRIREQLQLCVQSDFSRSLSEVDPQRSKYIIHEAVKKLVNKAYPPQEIFSQRQHLIAVARNAEHLEGGLWLMNILSGTCEQSWVQSIVASDTPQVGMYDDAYEKAYLSRYAERPDDWKRGESTSEPNNIHHSVCTAMEGNCRRAFEDFQVIIIRDQQAAATWLIKHPKNGEYGDWTTCINLNTGEVYLPGKELLSWVYFKSKEFSIGNAVVSIEELKKTLGADHLRIRFDRMVNPASSGFFRVRNSVLGEHALPQAA